MSKLKLLVEIEIETTTHLDDDSVKALANSVAEGAEENMAEGEELTVTNMSAEYVRAIDIDTAKPVTPNYGIQ